MHIVRTGNKVACDSTALPYSNVPLLFFGASKLPAFGSHGEDRAYVRVGWTNRRVLDFNNNYYNNNTEVGGVSEGL